MPGRAETAKQRLYDRNDGYGWISIALHWLAAVAVIALWILGKSIDGTAAENVDQRRALHMSVGITAWLLIAIRVGWRLSSGHPRIRGLTDLTYRLATTVHYLLLVTIALMLLSGPLMAWANGAAIPVFDWFEIPGPLGESEPLRVFAHSLHVGSANAMLALTVLHVGGALKHLMFHADDSIVRMLWPGRESSSK